MGLIKAEAGDHFIDIWAETETRLHTSTFRISDAKQDRGETGAAIQGLQGHDQDIVDFVVTQHGIGDIGNAVQQHSFTVGAVLAGGRRLVTGIANSTSSIFRDKLDAVVRRRVRIRRC